MNETTVVIQADMSRLKRHWVWVLALGLLFLTLGFMGLGMVVGLTVVSMFFFGALLLVAGFMHIVDVFKHREWKGMLGHALIAVLYLGGGVAVMVDPLLASTLITGILAGMLIVIGVTRVVMALSLRQVGGWGWLLLAGLSAIILGILIIAQWPYSGLWFIGMMIAIELIINGWTYIFIALALKRS